MAYALVRAASRLISTLGCASQTSLPRTGRREESSLDACKILGKYTRGEYTKGGYTKKVESIYWVVSRNCNQSCPHCYNNSPRELGNCCLWCDPFFLKYAANGAGLGDERIPGERMDLVPIAKLLESR